jgi:hypothetical protein
MGVMNRYVVVAAAAVTVPIIAAAVAIALGEGRGGATSAGPVPSVGAGTSFTESEPSAATSATIAPPSPSADAELKDGRHFGFIKSVDLETAPQTLAFDLAYRLVGEEANQAAAERGYETPVENDYFIVNDNPKLRTLPLSPDAEILLIDWNRCCDALVTVDPERFQAFFGHPKYSSLHPQGEFSQYWVTVAGGTVVKIEEQYRP